MKKYKITFEITEKFSDLIDEETFRKEYKGNLLKLCKYMYKMENIGFTTGNLKLVKAEFIN